MLSKEYRFISPTFYLSADGKEVTHIARARLTNVPALPDLKQVASAQDGARLTDVIVALAQKLGMPADTDPQAVLKAAEAAVEQLSSAADKRRTTGVDDARDAPPATTAQANDAEALSKVLATALALPETATSDEIVTALLRRQTAMAARAVAAHESRDVVGPIAAVADYMASSAEQRAANQTDRKVTAAMQSGKGPPGLGKLGAGLVPIRSGAI